MFEAKQFNQSKIPFLSKFFILSKTEIKINYFKITCKMQNLSKLLLLLLFVLLLPLWRLDTQHNVIQYNTTQYNDIQYKNTQCNNAQHDNIQYNNTQHK